MFGESPTKLEPEYADAYQAWKAAPTPATRSQLLRTVKPAIDTAMRSYGTASPTLRSQAKQMVLQALPSYDPQRASLGTHLISQLRGLQRVSQNEQQIIRVPEQVRLDQQYLYHTETQLRDQLGRDPADSEIADATGISTKRLRYLRQYRPPIAESTATQLTPDGNDVQEPATESLGPSAATEAWHDFVYADLAPTDQVIMDYSLGRNGSPQLPLKEIARRLGITPSAASQRAAKIQRLLDERDHLDMFQ